MSQAGQAKPQPITPGALWRDTQGEVIQAHGGGVLKVGKTYYWFGENRAPAPAGGLAAGVKCYSSKDLVRWRFRGDSLMRQSEGDLAPGCVIERPKVLLNRPTRTYVMYFHLDSPNYADAKVGVATSKTVAGPYTYHGGFRPLGHESRDMTLFEDRDGVGYLIFEDRKRGLSISQLSTDFLRVEREIALIPRAIESPAIVHVGGTYYLMGSHLTGWDANPNSYYTAPSLAGPWTPPGDVAPRETNTFDSQSSFILPVQGRKTTSYIYMGDRWQKGQNLRYARYVWLPLTVGENFLRLQWNEPWTVDVESGEIVRKGLPVWAEGDYRLTNRQNGWRLDVAGASTAPGAAVHVAPASESDSQIWRIAPAGFGYYSIASKRSGKRLDVSDKSMQNGALVTQWEANGGDNQLWRIAPATGGTFTLTAKHSDQQLALSHEGQSSVSQQLEAIGAAQEWQIVPVHP